MRMKKNIIILSVLLILLPFSGNLAGGTGFGLSTAFAEEEAAPDSAGTTSAESEAPAEDNQSIMSRLSGEVSVSGVAAGINGSHAKFNEFRDVNTGVYGGVKLKYDDDNYFMKFKASDIGYETQHYNLEGGIYGAVKYFMDYNEIPHNWTDNAKTIYNGVGTNYLTIMPSALNVAAVPTLGGKNPTLPVSSWNTFDYSIKRQQESGGVRIDLLKPFYIEFTGNREDRTGIRPNAIPYTNSPGTPGFAELPTPVSYVTQTFKGEAGYTTKPLFASVNMMYTDFNDANQVLYFQNATGNQDAFTLPPSDQSYRYGFRGSVAIPLNTRLNVSLSDSDTKSNANLFSSMMGNTNAGTAAAPNYILPIKYGNGATVWNGDVRTQNYAFVLTSNPVSFLNANIFYKYYNKDNKSDEITITSPTNVGATATTLAYSSASPNERISYHKNDFGMNLRFKLPEHFSLTGGYEYLKVDRNFEVLPETKDNVYSVGLKWNGLEFMIVKIGYERLNRDGDVDREAALSSGEPSLYNQYMIYDRRIDAAPQNRDTFKAGIDLFPIDNLALGLLYKYKRSTYPENLYGLQNTRKDEYTLNADYAFARFAKLDAFIEYENEKLYQVERIVANAASTPFTPPVQLPLNNTYYNYSIAQRDRTYNWGAGLDVYVIPKVMTLRFQYDYVNSDGFADYTIFSPSYLTSSSSSNPGSPVKNNDNIDIGNWDDYKKSAFMVKSTFNVSKSFTVVAGYCYERFVYSDASIDNYSYTIVGSGVSAAGSAGTTSYLTGAYSNPSYNASVIFLTGTYRF
jgi:MtrB/PioB family decaheme-associated outer membrane protein